MQTLYLAKREERRLLGGHDWIYSNEVDASRSPLRQFEPGEQVWVRSAGGDLLGIAYVNPHSLICARLLDRESSATIDVAWFATRLRQALNVRRRFYDKPWFRWVFGEADGLPGLVIDRYDTQVVVQCNTAGMEACKSLIVAALQQFESVSAILWRADSAIREQEKIESYREVVCGEWPSGLWVEENDVRFLVDGEEGQKTGWFFDHRDNRRYLQTLVRDKRVLDVFCYVGGWGLQSLAGGASHAHFIDASRSACDLVMQNAERQGVGSRVTVQVADAFAALQQLAADGRQFDVVVVDPPAFIKRKKDAAAGAQAYRKLNALALQCLAPGGLLVSASCSMHWSSDELVDSVRRAAARQGRRLQLNALRGQAADHPVAPAIPETDYLKAGFFSTLDI